MEDDLSILERCGEEKSGELGHGGLVRIIHTDVGIGDGLAVIRLRNNFTPR